MTLEQFNTASKEYSKQVDAEDTCNRFIVTIPTQFEYEEWETPTIIREPSGEIDPKRVKEVVKFRGSRDGTVLYNDNFIAYSYAKPGDRHEMGFLSKQPDGTWEGFGESTRQEYMQWLITTGVIPT